MLFEKISSCQRLEEHLRTTLISHNMNTHCGGQESAWGKLNADHDQHVPEHSVAAAYGSVQPQTSQTAHADPCTPPGSVNVQ